MPQGAVRVRFLSFYNDDCLGSVEREPTQGPYQKKEQANMTRSKIYAQEKLQDIQLQRLCVFTLISVVKGQKETHAFKYAS